MLREIDTICQSQGVYPHAFLSGHAHNYQRYTRSVQFGAKPFTVPFVVCGDGGHNVVPMVQSRGGVTPPDPAQGANVTYLDSKPAVQATKLVLSTFDHLHYGYLRISASAKQLQIAFHPIGATTPAPSIDTVIVDLASHTVV
jgi:hypothetical protein